MNYRVSVSEDFMGPSFNSFANCAEGARPISGGIDLEGSAATSLMGATYPALEVSRIWRSVGRNEGVGAMDMSFFAVCRALDPGAFRFRSETKPVNPGKRRSVRAPCPNGFRAIGGGLEFGQGLAVATAPYDGRDPDKKPDDGWRARAVNGAPSQAELTAHVSCREAGTWTLAYEREAFLVGGGSSALSTAICEEGAATGGGGTIAGPGAVRLHEAYPVDFGDVEDTIPENGWQLSVRNSSMGSAEAVVHAVCKT
jgi:hypothetical protein